MPGSFQVQPVVPHSCGSESFALPPSAQQQKQSKITQMLSLQSNLLLTSLFPGASVQGNQIALPYVRN